MRMVHYIFGIDMMALLFSVEREPILFSRVVVAVMAIRGIFLP
jgi:hypothetical protein